MGETDILQFLIGVQSGYKYFLLRLLGDVVVYLVLFGHCGSFGGCCGGGRLRGVEVLEYFFVLEGKKDYCVQLDLKIYFSSIRLAPMNDNNRKNVIVGH